MADAAPPPPTVDASGLREIAPGVFVIPDRRVPLVPNIGIVAGDKAVLVVDTGMGPANGKHVLEAAQKIAAGKPLILTLTHFHPEHGFGAQVFKGAARITYNQAQADELAAKGGAYLDMFRGFGPGVAGALEGTDLVQPDDTYSGRTTTIDLGGRVVELATWGNAHTRGDQIVWLPAERILFTGDLAEERIFPIFPWFPPHDADIDAATWAALLAELEGRNPAIVVPGHGDVGGKEILAAVRTYMTDLGQRVKAARAEGKDEDAIIAALSAKVRSEHPDWESPEWIDFAIRYYATLS
jgi:glyoxylase-like metal-dependent hydrolase (beta-lactamase superfamily II)